MRVRGKGEIRSGSGSGLGLGPARSKVELAAMELAPGAPGVDALPVLVARGLVQPPAEADDRVPAAQVRLLLMVVGVLRAEVDLGGVVQGEVRPHVHAAEHRAWSGWAFGQG